MRSLVSLTAYVRERRIENQRVLTVMDGFEKALRVKNPLIKWVRETGIDSL